MQTARAPTHALPGHEACRPGSKQYAIDNKVGCNEIVESGRQDSARKRVTSSKNGRHRDPATGRRAACHYVPDKWSGRCASNCSTSRYRFEVPRGIVPSWPVSRTAFVSWHGTPPGYGQSAPLRVSTPGVEDMPMRSWASCRHWTSAPLPLSAVRGEA